MSGYAYDHLLTSHFEKSAGFVGNAMSAVGQGIAKHAPGIATSIGKGVANTAMGGARALKNFVGGGGLRQGLGVGMQVGFTAPTAASSMNLGRTVTASLREMAHVYNLQKNAEHGALEKALHVAPYASWGLGAAIEGTDLDKKYPLLRPTLTLAPYFAYAGRSAHDAVTKPEERISGGIDAGALALMGVNDLMRYLRPTPAPAH